VINAGAGVKNNHRDAVNCASHNAPNVLVQGGKYYAKYGGNYTEAAPHNVRDHVKNFFPSGIVGQSAVSKFCSCHKKVSFLVLIIV
jgi:hypothetical protein